MKKIYFIYSFSCVSLNLLFFAIFYRKCFLQLLLYCCKVSYCYFKKTVSKLLKIRWNVMALISTYYYYYDQLQTFGKKSYFTMEKLQVRIIQQAITYRHYISNFYENSYYASARKICIFLIKINKNQTYFML